MTRAWLLQRSRNAALAVVAAVSLAGSASAKPVPSSELKDRTEELPTRLKGIDVEEKLDAEIPKDVTFRDDQGRAVRLGDFVDGKVPIIVTFNYSSCPMLCSLQLNGLVTALKQVEWELGKDYRVVTVVLDPEETPDRAKETKARYLREYGRPGGDSGWHFLTGPKAHIDRAAAGLGFSYGYNEKRDEYVHPAAFAMLTPDGKIARYLYGIEYHPKTVSLSLVDVADGKIGSPFDKLILYCFHYDETEGKYAPVAMNIMRVGGGLSALVLGSFLTSFWMKESKKKKQPKQGPPRAS